MMLLFPLHALSHRSYRSSGHCAQSFSFLWKLMPGASTRITDPERDDALVPAAHNLATAATAQGATEASNSASLFTQEAQGN